MKDLIKHVLAECSTVDVDCAYDEMLDECYSFKCVGGIFQYMSPSRVLAECDPTAYRCGKNDWLDGERDRWVEIEGDYYDRGDVDDAKEEFVDDLKAKLEELEEELAEFEPGSTERENIAMEIQTQRELIEEAESYEF